MSHRPETLLNPDIYKIRTHINAGQQKYSILPFMTFFLAFVSIFSLIMKKEFSSPLRGHQTKLLFDVSLKFQD